MPSARSRGVVLVHGGFHGAWCWDSVSERLRANGISVSAPDLPMSSLAEDVAVVRESINGLASKTGRHVVLAGHSYGGIVLSAQADDAPIHHLAFVAAVAADVGESIVDAVNADAHEPSALASVTQVVDGWMRPLPGPIAEVLYHDCSPEDTAAAVARLRPQALACVTDPSPDARWKSVPSTYVVCDDDRALPPGRQRDMARRANASTLAVASGHSIFITNPDVVAELLTSLARI